MSRYEKIATKLADFGLDALLVSSRPNRRYVTGFPSSAGTDLV